MDHYKLWDALGSAGYTLDEIHQLAKAGGKARKAVTNKRHPTPQERQERANEMADAYRNGLTLQQVADHYKLTRERVRQVLRKFGIAADEGGRSLRGRLNEEARKSAARENRDVRVLHFYGCTQEEALANNEGLKISDRDSLAMAYRSQRRNAEARGVGWEFTFPSWVKAWKDSGKLDLRGRHADAYVMGRKGDEGPYSPDNVEFLTLRENARFAQLKFAGLRDRDANGLTKRQQDTLRLYQGGAKTAAELAVGLGVGYGTAYSYLSFIERFLAERDS